MTAPVRTVLSWSGGKDSALALHELLMDPAVDLRGLLTTVTDGSQRWIVYHSKDSPTPGWARSVWMQPFAWTRDGAPSFGEPIGPRVAIPLPSGECPSR